MVDPAHKGRIFPPYQFTVERGKVREFLLAIGDDSVDHVSEGTPIPPTYPIVFIFWGDLKLENVLNEIGVELKNVLHAEQEYKYLAPISVGDTVTGQMQVADIHTKGGGGSQLEFVELAIEYRNQTNQPVLLDRISLIVRA